nr:major capsid protein [Myoviridae environmental samples]
MGGSADDIWGVQPMSGLTGQIFALRAHYGSQPTGPFGRPGDLRTGFQTGSAVDGGGNTVAQQWQAAGKAPNEAFYNVPDTAFSGTGVQTALDGSVAYSAYTVGHGVATTAGETAGGNGTNDIAFNEMSFTIEKTGVEAQTRLLKGEYTHELAQDLKVTHGLDAETELANILSTEIMLEINREFGGFSRRYLGGSADE